jgi:hypothetical protein
MASRMAAAVFPELDDAAAVGSDGDWPFVPQCLRSTTLMLAAMTNPAAMVTSSARAPGGNGAPAPSPGWLATRFSPKRAATLE